MSERKLLKMISSMTATWPVPAAPIAAPDPEVRAVARLVPLGTAKPRIADEALFGRIVATAFGQRRRTMRNALAAICDAAALTAAGIDPGARGETPAVADVVRLAAALVR